MTNCNFLSEGFVAVKFIIITNFIVVSSVVIKRVGCTVMFCIYLFLLSFSYIAKDEGYPHNIFLISLRKHMLWYSLEAPRRGASNECPQHMFSWRNKKDINIFRMKNVPYRLLCSYNASGRLCSVIVAFPW